MSEKRCAAVLKADRVMADGSWQMAKHWSDPKPSAISHQPSAMSMDTIRDLMWRRAGLFRTSDGLTDAVETLERIDVSAGIAADRCRYRNLVTIARLIARAALRREESRGGHFRQDFPNRDDLHWKVHFIDCADR
jgi:aspartate oxidase